MRKGHSKRRKKSKVNFRKIGIIAGATIVAIGLGYTVYSHLPFVKVNKAIAAGNKYTQEQDYEAAISSYSEAIEIDSGSVTAYSNMAGAYLSIDDAESAKQVLYDGWQNTENETLFDNYLTVSMNEAVNTMNQGNGNIDTVFGILAVLEEDNDNAEAIQILDAAYDRCFNGFEDIDSYFRSTDSGCSYEKYSELITGMLSVYEAAPNDELKNVILKYALPASESFTMNYEDAVSYGQLIQTVETKLGNNDKLDSFVECINNAAGVQALFSNIFEQLDVGNVDELRSFIVTDEYVNYRNIFLNNEYTPQENTTYITVSREAMIFNCNEDKWTYRFLNFEENPSTAGVITVWANFFEDDGVQRNSISYEPASIGGNMYPHTKYSVTYLKSYITKGSSTKVAQLNYRLSTVVTAEDGSSTESIVGDWGGENEWVMDIDTIESLYHA